MVDENDFELNSSQGVFSQTVGNFDYIWDELSKSDNTVKVLGSDWGIGSTSTSDMNVENLASSSGIQVLNNGIATVNEQIEDLSPSTDVLQHHSSVASAIQYTPSSLPASQTWPGEYEFTVSFNPETKTSKGVSWTYSKLKEKLYVGKDVPCPINFSANNILSSDVYIRVMALYSSPEQVSEVVKRCVNHSMKEIKNGIPEAEHLIRCESYMASYEVDSITGCHSVIIPFENPPVGQQFSTYIYKFACFGSCAGGPNRRPLMLIFTLERDNHVIGRRKLDVKICACPGRDRKTEESSCVDVENLHQTTKKRKGTDESVNVHLKKVKMVPNKDELYSIKVEKKGCAEFLLQMKQLNDTYQNISNLSPDMIKTILHFQKKKNEDSD